MKIQIRQAQISDLPYIYDICIKTGFNGQDATDILTDKYIVGQYYAAPYLHYDIDTCFVITDRSIPKGYIVGTSYTENFNEWMNRTWLPEIREKYPKWLNPISDYEKFLIDTIHEDCYCLDFLNAYPSHLHIDLLPSVQRKGFGRQLMEEFIKSIKMKGSTGLYVIVDTANPEAIAFYKKVGFSDIRLETGAIYMGIKLFNNEEN